jgi:hypothetical protein
MAKLLGDPDGPTYAARAALSAKNYDSICWNGQFCICLVTGYLCMCMGCVDPCVRR